MIQVEEKFALQVQAALMVQTSIHSLPHAELVSQDHASLFICTLVVTQTSLLSRLHAEQSCSESALFLLEQLDALSVRMPHLNAISKDSRNVEKTISWCTPLGELVCTSTSPSLK